MMIMFLKKVWRKIVPDKVKNAIAKFYLIDCHGLKVHHFGNLNPNKKYYVIKSPGPNRGIFSLILDTLACFDNAERRNAIPVVDFQDVFMPIIQDEENAYKENPWTYYFQQPIEQISLEEVYQSKNVIVGLKNVCTTTVGLPRNWYDLKVLYDEKYDKWRKLFRKYIKLQPALQKRADELYSSFFPKDEKVMGVAIRAGYRYNILCKNDIILNHPITLSCEEFIKKVEATMQEWKYTTIFISSDDWEYRNKISAYFRDKAIYMPRELRHYFENDMPVEKSKVSANINSVRKITEEYIIETYLLSKCNGLFATLNTTAEIAFFWNDGKYEHCELYDQGLCKSL